MRTERGEEIADDSFLLLFNAHFDAVEFTLPTRRFGLRWEVELATAEVANGSLLAVRDSVRVQAHSLTLLRRAA